MTHEWESNTTEVRTTTETTDYDIWVFTCHLHLLLCLQSDDCLVQGYVTKYRTEGVLAVWGTHGEFDSLRDSCTERTLVVRVACQHILSSTGRHRRRSRHLRPVGLHDATTVRLLLVRNLHLIDRSLQSEHLGSIRESRTPLACTRLGRHVRDSLLLAVVSLSKRRVQLMRTYRTNALVLKINMCRSAQRLLQSVGTDKRR